MLVSMGEDVYAQDEEIRDPRRSEYVYELVSYVKLVKSYLRKYLTLPEDQKIIVETLTESTDGQFKFSTQSIHLDSRILDKWEFLTILCHEAVHAEQYFQNRFSCYLSSSKSYVKFLNHTYLVTENDIGSSERPWEEEAYRRENVIASAILEDIARGD